VEGVVVVVPVHHAHRVRHRVRAIAEQILVALLSNFFSWFANVAEYLPVHSISAWSGGTGFGGPAAPADLAKAGFVLIAYTLVLGALAFWTFHRRDVQGATGGG